MVFILTKTKNIYMETGFNLLNVFKTSVVSIRSFLTSIGDFLEISNG